MSDYKEKRENLKALSVEAKKLVKIGAFETVNDAIIETVYKKEGHSEFNTFYGWLSNGFKVKKGSKAFVVWGRPKQVKNKEAKEDEDDEFKHFPLAYLFSNLQVEPQENRKEAA